MNMKSLLTASLVGGLISTALVNTPYISLINILLCAGFWIGPIVAVWLYRRLDGTLTFRAAVFTGLLAGAWHGLFGLVLSPLGLAGAGGLLNDVQPFISPQDFAQLETSMTGFGRLLFNLIGAAIDVAFGFLGGLISGAMFRTDRVVRKPGVQL